MNSSLPPTGRFAPSPTGPLHFGSLIAAVASYLDARALGGKWIVRIEDIDTLRCDPAHERQILHTLEAFGLHWDGEVVRQSERVPRYEAVIDELQRLQQCYACECSRREISDSSFRGVDGPVYSGRCRPLGLDAAGNALRLRADGPPIQFEDRVQGLQTQDLESMVGDFIIRRRDGVIAYQLAVVVDDHLQGVTHVVRGADLLDSTARQLLLYRRLGYPTPRYLHHPVITNELGQKLSKQTLATPVADVGTDQAQLLRQALQFLGQDTTGLADATAAELLSVACKRWNVARIPRARSLGSSVESQDAARNSSL